jgi:hypothetical protein
VEIQLAKNGKQITLNNNNERRGIYGSVTRERIIEILSTTQTYDRYLSSPKGGSIVWVQIGDVGLGALQQEEVHGDEAGSDAYRRGAEAGGDVSGGHLEPHGQGLRLQGGRCIGAEQGHRCRGLLLEPAG